MTIDVVNFVPSFVTSTNQKQPCAVLQLGNFVDLETSTACSKLNADFYACLPPHHAPVLQPG
jgi:hypothetical protein